MSPHIHKLCRIIPFLFLISLPTSLFAQLVYPGSVDIIGSEEIVFDWSADNCEQTDIPDAPARFFRDADGKIQLIAPHYTNYRMIGDDFNSLIRDCANGPILTSHLSHDPAQWNDHEWILGTYTIDGRTIHAIIHNEFHGADNTDFVSCPSGDYLKCWYNGLTYASSTDTGRTFTHATAPDHFIATIPYPYEPDIGPSGIFGGSNIVRNPNDGYYYVLIHLEARGAYDWGTGIMRTQDLSDPTSWRAWGGSDYDVVFVDPHNDTGFDPNDHVAKPIAGNGALEKMHQSLTWNTYFNKWMIVGSAQKGGVWGFYYSLSEDLIHWTVRKKIMDANLIIDPGHSTNEDVLAYPTIVDHADTSRNFEITGQDVHLYFTRMHPGNLYDRDLVRVPIRFNKLLMDTLVVTGGGNKEDNNPGNGICNTSAGKCSFKAAIEESNNRPPWYADSTVYIKFNMDYTELKTINVDAGIQTVFYPVHIDGFTQPGASANTAAFGDSIDAKYMIELKFDGNNSIQGLAFESSKNTIRGLILNGQQGACLQFNFSDSNVVQGVFINVENDGATKSSPGNDGIMLTSSSHNLIGDTTAAGRNLIVGGIRIVGPDSRENRIEGNYIGTDLTGTKKLDQWAAGITLQDDAQNNIIGGMNVNARNLISGNNSAGVQINNSGSSGNEILNNYIGVNASGTATIAQTNGVTINGGAEGNFIGKPGAGNVICGSTDAGIWIDGAARNFIQGNYIGTDASGTLELGNTGPGIYLQNNCEQTVVGGAGPDEANTIAYNQNGGIALQSNAGTGIKIWSNAIYENANGLGIDLGFDDWPNEGDDKDTDTGVNNWQNAPVLLSATNGETQINGMLNSTPNTAFRIEFFVSDTSDPSGYGEGQRYLDAMEITTDADGNATINTTLPHTVEQGKFITATASDPNWNTSEFSNAVVANPFEGILAVSPEIFTESIEVNSSTSGTLTISNTGNQSVDWLLSWQAAWISAVQTTATIQPQTSTAVEVTFDATGLTASTYIDTLIIQNNNGTQEDLLVQVQLSVTETPHITVAPDSINEQIAQGSNLTKTITVTNSGNDTLNWFANVPPGQNWLSTNNPSGSIPSGQVDNFNVQLDASAISTGTYTSEVAINSNDTENPLVEVPVSFTVEESIPELWMNSDNFSTTLAQEDSLTFLIEIKNTGSGGLNWALSWNAGWIDVSPTLGLGQPEKIDSIYIKVNSTGLSIAAYTDTLLLASSDPNMPQRKIAVGMQVTNELPQIGVSQSNLVATLNEGESTVHPIAIFNNGTADLQWSMAWQKNWVQPSHSSGIVQQGGSVDFSVTVDATGLAEGDHADTLLIASNDPNTPLVMVEVYLTVIETGNGDLPDIFVSVDTLHVQIASGGIADRKFKIYNSGPGILNFNTTWAHFSKWLSVQPQSGSLNPGDSVKVLVHMQTDTLAPGTHHGAVMVHSNDPDTPNIVIEVVVEIMGAPFITLVPETLVVSINSGETAKMPFHIGNNGFADLQWQISKNTLPDWLIADKYIGTILPGDSMQVQLVLNAANLNGGTTENFAMEIASTDPDKPSVFLNLQLIVNTNVGVLSFSDMPQNYILSQNFPNPFNPGTVIHYAVPEQAWVRLTIYDISGRLVYRAVDELQNPSHYQIKWDGKNTAGQPVAAGVYVYKMTAHGASGKTFVQTKKMMFLK